jgi:hypothetical protein
VWGINFIYENNGLEKEVLGRTNSPTFPIAVVAIVTLAKDCVYVM